MRVRKLLGVSILAVAVGLALGASRRASATSTDNCASPWVCTYPGSCSWCIEQGCWTSSCGSLPIYNKNCNVCLY